MCDTYVAGHRAGDMQRQAQSSLGDSAGTVLITMLVGRRVQPWCLLVRRQHGGEAKPRKILATRTTHDVINCQILGPQKIIKDFDFNLNSTQLLSRYFHVSILGLAKDLMLCSNCRAACSL